MKETCLAFARFGRKLPFCRQLVPAGVCLAAVLSSAAFAVEAKSSAGPTGLQCDSLTLPLGIDDPAPTFSWKLTDNNQGAEQTAYEITVTADGPGRAKADVWDSGRVTSSATSEVRYRGPALAPSHRYYWQVRVWGRDGKSYPVSDAAWWETGLMATPWKAAWIGLEPEELHRLRTSDAAWITNAKAEVAADANVQHDFRLHLHLARPVRSAALYAAGEDTVAAWVNDRQVMQANSLPPWKQMPWKTYLRRDITADVKQGDNVVAVGVTHYALPSGGTMRSQTPMSACVYVVYADGATELFVSGAAHWKAMANAPGSWWSATADDAGWPGAERWKPAGAGADNAGPGRPWPTGPVALLRHTFHVEQKPVSARLYATALGAYKLLLNGQPVGDQFLAPGWTDYREHVPYQVYDVTAAVRGGDNALAGYLASGWYATPLKWYRQGNNYGATQPALKAQLRLAYADGSVKWIATDASWKAHESEIAQAELYDGQTEDGRKRISGWAEPRFEDAAWTAATEVHPADAPIIAQDYQPIRAERTLTARAITSPVPGTYIFDFGQNMSAVPRLVVQGQKGDQVRLRFGEVLNADGTLYTENLRTAKVTDYYTLAGGAAETFEPDFTFHGFRYAEVTGLRARPTNATLQAIVLHTDAPFTTHFTSGSPMLNQLWSNVLWGQRSNFVGVPTDCPQRDERLGWTADAQVFWRTATYNMDLAAFSTKFAADLHGTQAGTSMYGIYAPGVEESSASSGAGWSDAGVIIPWTSWMQSGNTRVVDESWAGMEAYLAEIARNNPQHLWQKGFGTPFGDWLTPTITTPEDLLATAYWALDASMMRDMAAATSRTAEAAKYGAMYGAIKAAFAKAYVQPDGTVGTIDHFPSIPPPSIHPESGDARNQFVETQTGYVLALHMGLVPEALRAAAATRLVGLIEKNQGLLGTGFLGTPYLLEVLSDTGHSDEAYRLLLNTAYPSWGYLVEHGATTMWERWNGDQMRDDPSMNSYNHYAYGAVAEWMYRYAAGVDTQADGAGFRVVHLHPNFSGRLGKLAFDYDAAPGTIHSDWSVTGEKVAWNVTIPANTTAVFQPGETNAVSYEVSGKPLSGNPLVHVTGPGVYALEAGVYHFTAVLAAQQNRPGGVGD